MLKETGNREGFSFNFGHLLKKTNIREKASTADQGNDRKHSYHAVIIVSPLLAYQKFFLNRLGVSSNL